MTLDLDGSVCSTRGHAEGTAVGYNVKKKGARRYYPLFCKVAQSGQFLDVLHRPGNVHDSKGYHGNRSFISARKRSLQVALFLWVQTRSEKTDLLHRDYLLCLLSNCNRVIAKEKTRHDT